jgi:hypothetical protein
MTAARNDGEMTGIVVRRKHVAMLALACLTSVDGVIAADAMNRLPEFAAAFGRATEPSMAILDKFFPKAKMFVDQIRGIRFISGTSEAMGQALNDATRPSCLFMRPN